MSNKYLEKIAESQSDSRLSQLARGTKSALGGAISGAFLGSVTGGLLSGAGKFRTGSKARKLVTRGGMRAGAIYGAVSGALQGARDFKKPEGIMD